MPLLPCDKCGGRSLGICAPFDNEAISSLVEMGAQRTWAKRQLLFQVDDPVEAFYKIKKGIVVEYKMLTDGRRQVVAVRSVGDLCGYSARAGRHELSAEAITPVEACAFGAVKFQLMVEHDIRLASAVAADLAQRLKQMGDALTTIGQLSAAERVAHFIFEMEKLEGGQERPTNTITLHLTRQDIGDYLGLTLETVSRCFATLKDKGLIALVGKEAVSVLDRKGLMQLAMLD
jgi:CRP/FNR family transcriptional regulator